MEETPTSRIIEQRVRNRIMEALLALAEGDDRVREAGPSEYFEDLYDWVPHRADEIRPNSALTEDEAALVLEVSLALDEACDTTPQMATIEELIAAGWPERIKPLAQAALKAMIKRGRFSEDVEEDEPGSVGAWP